MPSWSCQVSAPKKDEYIHLFIHSFIPSWKRRFHEQQMRAQSVRIR